MPLKPARHLPRQFSRSVSKRTQMLAQRRQHHRLQWKRERLLRWWHRLQHNLRFTQRFLVRWLLVGVSAALLLILGYFLFSPVIRVREITVVRADPRLDIEQVQQALSPLFGRHPLFVSLLEVRTLLQGAMPSLTSVELEKVYPDQLRVTPRLEPLALRVAIIGPDEEALEPPTEGAEWSQFITAGGWYVQTTTPQQAGDLPYAELVDWGARPNPGTRAVAPGLLERMQMVEKALLEQFGQGTVGRTVYLRAQEFHLTVKMDETGTQRTLWFDMRGTVEEQLQRYRTFLQAALLQETTQYVDLRLKDRVIFK